MKKNKVLLSTFSRAPNFGAFMQTYATKMALIDHNFEVENYDPNGISYYWKNLFKPQGLVNFFRSLVYLNSQNSNFRHQKSDKYHAVIVGSDQVLNQNCQKNKLLKCLKPEVNAKKIIGLAMSTYSADQLEINKIADLLDGYSSITFREQTLVDKFSAKEIICDLLPDPTFSLNKDDLQLGLATSQDSALCAGYDLEKWASAIKESKIRYINFNIRHFFKFGISFDSPTSVLKKIHNSKIVYTNSYHFLILSMILGKIAKIPFDKNNSGGDRMMELFRRYKFENDGKFYIYNPNNSDNISQIKQDNYAFREFIKKV